MHTFVKSLAIVGLTALAACGGDTRAPGKTDSPAKTAKTVSPEIAAFDHMLVLINKVAEDMNSIKTEEDAHRLKNAIAVNIRDMYAIEKDLRDQAKSSETVEKKGQMRRMIKLGRALKRVDAAWDRIEETHPEFEKIIKMEMATLRRSK
jgi:hypothetical protein